MNSRIERKHSKKRDAILRVIRSTVSHPGAQWVYDQLKPSIPGLSLGTVYRNINLFEKEGSVSCVGVVNGEERFDAVVTPHPHAVCTRCGKMGDLPVTNESIQVFKDKGQGDFIIDYRRTVFYGLCRECHETLKAEQFGLEISNSEQRSGSLNPGP